nr:membrane protein insertion efficiency factor YidD [Roseburia sp. AF42-8]
MAASFESSWNYLKIISKRRWNDFEKILIAIIKFYRKYLSPMKTTKCPYCPTCSTYGLIAVEKYGAVKGGALALWRILRCNPFSKGGYDPVP